MSIGEQMRKLRGNMTQTEAAELAGMTQQAWRVYENDNSMPGAKALLRISKAFGVPTDWILENERAGSVVATNSAIVIGCGNATNNATAGSAEICKKCEIRKRLERIEKALRN